MPELPQTTVPDHSGEPHQRAAPPPASTPAIPPGRGGPGAVDPSESIGDPAGASPSWRGTASVGPAAELIASASSIARVLRSVTAAMQPPRLAVGLLLAAALMAAGHLWDAISPAVITADGLTVRARATPVGLSAPGMPGAPSASAPGPEPGLAPGLAPGVAPGLAPGVASGPTFAVTLAVVVERTQGVVLGTLRLAPGAVAESLVELLVGVPIGLWRHDRLFLFGYGAIFLALAGLLGGALSRMAACDLSGAERLGAEEAIAFAASCWRSMVLAPVAPLLIAGLLWAIIALLGLAMRWPWLEVLGAVLFGLAVVLGILVALSLLGYAFAFPLLVPAVACERCDAGEAQQRAFAYLLQRPARLMISMALGIVGFALGYLVIAGVAAATLQVTTWGIALGAGDAAARLPDGYGPFRLMPSVAPVGDGVDGIAIGNATGGSATGLSARIADGIVGFWRTIVVGIVAGWVFSYYYAASTSIYLSLREATDGQEPSEIWRPGMVHGTFMMATDPVAEHARRAAARPLESRWRASLAWFARRRG